MDDVGKSGRGSVGTPTLKGGCAAPDKFTESKLALVIHVLVAFKLVDVSPGSTHSYLKNAGQ